MDIVLLFGKPGAGKGTQGKLLEAKFGFKHLNTGDMIRAEKKKDTPLGAITRKLELYQFLDNENTCKMFEPHFNLNANIRGYALDGIPRTVVQAGYIDGILRANPQLKPIMFDLQVRSAVAEERMIKRKRLDDTYEVIQRRFEIYHEDTAPVLDFLRGRIPIIDIDADLSVEHVHNKIVSYLI